MNKYLRKLASQAAIVLLLSTAALAQSSGQWQAVNVIVDYDLDSTSEVFVATGNIGTGAGDGVFPAYRYDKMTMFIIVSQSDATGGIDARIQCRVSGSSDWLQYYPELTPGTVTPSYVNIATTGGWGKEISGSYYQCRVGMKINTADPGDAGANLEEVSVIVATRT